MKNTLGMAAVILGFGALSSQASIKDLDGCYQLYTPGVVYPVICLSGTTEEGINGSGVRLAIFHTNSNKLEACARSSSSGMPSNDSFVYEVAAKRK